MGGFRRRAVAMAAVAVQRSPLVPSPLPAQALLLLLVGVCGVRCGSKCERQAHFPAVLGRQEGEQAASRRGCAGRACHRQLCVLGSGQHQRAGLRPSHCSQAARQA